MSPPSLMCGEDRFSCLPWARGSDYTNYKYGKNRQHGYYSPRNYTKNFVDSRPVVPSGRRETCRPESPQPPQPRLSPPPTSNIDRFLQSTTPSVPVQFHPKASTTCSKDCGPESPPYFVLNDLWEAFTEWSFYGAGVPLALWGREPVVQYYVPSLSGIQLYAEPSRHATDVRRPVEESDPEFLKDSSSYAGSDSESDGSSRSSDTSVSRSTQGSLRDKTDDFFSDDSDVYAQEPLLFEYFERERPHDRVPFSDKISELASQYPELRTLKTCELLPTSWVSVAWYPIYRIPAGPTVRDLEACYLTFHSLSLPGGSLGKISQPVSNSIRNDSVSETPFTAIGMAAYKLQGSTWSVHGGHNRLRPLQLEAEKLIKQLQVIHPDYQHFINRR